MLNDTEKTRIVHCKRNKYDVYIGRPSKWGNPFTHSNSKYRVEVVANRDTAISFYEEWIRKNSSLISELHELKDKILGCWCPPSNCHGQVLLKLLKEFKIED
jgi:hypothetical protein